MTTDPSTDTDRQPFDPASPENRIAALSAIADELRGDLDRARKGSEHLNDLMHAAKRSLMAQAASYPPGSEGRSALRTALFKLLVVTGDRMFKARAHRGDEGGWAYVDRLIEQCDE